MAKKNVRLDGTRLISSCSTDNPKLGAKMLKDGRESLYLDYYLGYHIDDNGKAIKERKRETLKLYLHNSRSAILKQEDKDTLELARRIRFEREQELKEGKLGYRLQAKKMNCIDYMETYAKHYTKKDDRMIRASVRYFREFLAEYYPLFVNNLPCEKLTDRMVRKFLEYLQETHKGEGPATYYSRFKKIITSAVKDELFQKNPCDGIVCRADSSSVVTKDVLSMDEMAQLIETHYEGENPDIRRAFIFTLYTGVRFCDVKDLRYSCVDYANRILKFEQDKTKGHSSHSWVTIPLTDDVLELIGEGDKKDRIFPLPSHTMCLKALRHWTARAGIDKHITWHCGRHSFATNILSNGANVRVVQSLLGHSSLKYTERYARAVDSQKLDAVLSLPKLHNKRE